MEVVETTAANNIVERELRASCAHYLSGRDLAGSQTFQRSSRPFSASKAGNIGCGPLHVPLETSAVAIAGQALLAEQGDGAPDDDRSYRHPYIAPLGAAAIPLVRAAVAKKRTLHEGFVSSYIAAGTAALKEKLLQPQFVLAQVGLLLPDNSDAIRTAYFGKMFPQGSAQFRDERELDAFPDLSVVRFERYNAPGPLTGRIPGLASLRNHRGFAYAIPRGRGARTYLLAARDTEAIVDLIERLAGMERLPPEGLLFSLD